MTIYLCPHIPNPPTPRGYLPFMVTASDGVERWLCQECAGVATYDGRGAWATADECVEDAEPGAEYAVMSPPYCGNSGCDHHIEKDGYCTDCWPKCHLVDCTVTGCDNAMPVEDAEEFYGKCSDHRPLPYTSYERGP